jgi:hypothetical protein
VGGQTNSIVNGATDLIIGGSCNFVVGFKQSGNKIFGGYANEIQGINKCGEIFGGKLNKLRENGTTEYQYSNKIIGGEQNDIAYNNQSSVILGGVKNYIRTYKGLSGKNLTKSSLILSSYNSTICTGPSNYTPDDLIPGILYCCSIYNNIIGSRQSQITSQYSSFESAPKYTNIIGGCKNLIGGNYSNILSGQSNCLIGNARNKNDLNNIKHMQIISSDSSRICGNLYGNMISSWGSNLFEQSRLYSGNMVSSFFSYGLIGSNLFSTAANYSNFSFGLASLGGKFNSARVISSRFPAFNTLDTATVSTRMIISSDLNFFGESFGVDGTSTQNFLPGATNNIYPQRNSLILSSSLVMNYNTFKFNSFLGGDPNRTSIISSNKILSGYNLKAPSYFPFFSPGTTPFDNGKDDPMTAVDNTLMISNYCSCQRTNANSLMISTINSRMSNGLCNSIVGGYSNQIKSFGPGFFNYVATNAEGDDDGRILRAIFGGEVPGIDLGLSRHNMILGGKCNGFYSICGQNLEIGTAGPGLLKQQIATDILSGTIELRRSMNTRYSSIIGGHYNRIIADIGTATPTGKNKGVVCNPILNSVILGGYGNEMRISNHTGVDNLIISGIPYGASNSNGILGGGGFDNFGITGTFSNPTSITVCRGFVVGVTTSDQRLKIIIEKIGQSNWNLNIYLFRYISDPERVYQGFIAQELLNTKYELAVSTGKNGFYQVDYSKIDVEFKEVDYAKKDFQYSSI